MRLSDPATFIATWGGSGLAPRAPGTFGTLAALPFAALIHWLAGDMGALALGAAALAAYGIGTWACNRILRGGGGKDNKDPGFVVIDEVVGIWVTLVPAGLDWRLYMLGFVLFRILDIAKPWPLSWADREAPGAHGVMLDDLMAGLIALPLVYYAGVWLGG